LSGVRVSVEEGATALDEVEKRGNESFSQHFAVYTHTITKVTFTIE